MLQMTLVSFLVAAKKKKKEIIITFNSKILFFFIYSKNITQNNIELSFFINENMTIRMSIMKPDL